MVPGLIRFLCLLKHRSSSCIPAAQPESPREPSTAPAVILLMLQGHRNTFRTFILKTYTGVWLTSAGSQAILILYMGRWHYVHPVLFSKAFRPIRMQAEHGGLRRISM